MRCIHFGHPKVRGQRRVCLGASILRGWIPCFLGYEMKHYIISEEQIRQLTHKLISVDYLETTLPELKRLSDEEIYALEEPARQKWNAKADEQNGWGSLGWDEMVVLMGHEIMDKLGVPK